MDARIVKRNPIPCRRIPIFNKSDIFFSGFLIGFLKCPSHCLFTLNGIWEGVYLRSNENLKLG